MAKEDNQKKGIFSRALGTIKWIKILANPITWYVLFAILIILLLAGIIALISALPGMISGKFAEMVSNSVDPREVVTGYEITNDEVKEMAIYLEQMGYDIENYGFIENIERKTVVEGETYTNDVPSRGEIVSVESKYLEAYIGEEKKMYKVSPENYYKADITEDYYLMKSIKEFVKNNDENLLLYYYYQLKGTDLTSLSIETRQKFEDGKQRATVEIANKINEAYNTSMIEGKSREIGAGMIVLKGIAIDSDMSRPIWMRGVNGVETFYEFYIDKENRKLIIYFNYIPEDSFWDKILESVEALKGMNRTHLYEVDLEEYLSKYGRPSEFTTGIHLATQAPDFVYRLCTSSATDTKVYMDIYPRENEYTAVVADGSTYLLISLIESQDKNAEIHRKYVQETEKHKDTIVNHIATRLIDPDIDGDSLENHKAEADRIFQMTYNTLINGSYSDVKHVIDAIQNAFGISLDAESWELIPIKGVNCSYYDLESLKKMVPNFQQTLNTGTPYITQVVQHWYRNEYFYTEEKELERAKLVATSFLENVKDRIIIRTDNAKVDKDITKRVDEYKEEINDIEPEVKTDSKGNTSPIIKTVNVDGIEYKIRSDVDKVCQRLEEFYASLSSYFEEDVRSNMQRFLQIKLDDIRKRYGTTYAFVDVEDKYISLEGFNGLDSSSTSNANRVISSSYWRVHTDQKDIVQIHNPTFEDNSRFIRNWFKDKYVIYDGVSRPKDDRVIGAKNYIQAKTALDSLLEMLEKATTDKNYLKYTVRDVSEFMKDYAFDLYETVDTVNVKDLDNIMPEYVPYTPWPSEYEKADSNWTKMIFKPLLGATEFVAPADCELTIKGTIMELGIKDENGLVYEYMYVSPDQAPDGHYLAEILIDGKMLPDVDVNKKREYKRGDTIGYFAPVLIDMYPVSFISLKVQMLSSTKQKIDVTTRMNVRSKEISEIKKEIDYIYDIMSAATTYDTSSFLGISYDPDENIYNQECLALLNTAFNRISCPSCMDTSLSTIYYEEMGIEKRNLSNPKDEFEKSNTDVFDLIQLALNGSDRTKDGTILGSIAYKKIWTHKELKENQENAPTMYDDSELQNVNLKTAIGGGAFYIQNAEYEIFQSYYINSIVKSIFVQLNQQKDELNEQKGYTAGYGKYKISKTEETVDGLTKYIAYIEDTIYGLAENSCITSVIVTDVNEEIDETEEKKFIDTFRITVNANISIDITIKYNCTEEGEIIYDEMEYELEEVERM